MFDGMQNAVEVSD